MSLSWNWNKTGCASSKMNFTCCLGVKGTKKAAHNVNVAKHCHLLYHSVVTHGILYYPHSSNLCLDLYACITEDTVLNILSKICAACMWGAPNFPVTHHNCSLHLSYWNCTINLCCYSHVLWDLKYTINLINDFLYIKSSSYCSFSCTSFMAFERTSIRKPNFQIL